MMPCAAPHSIQTCTLRVLLWSVMAINCRPLFFARPMMRRGLISRLPQGDRQVWICRSALYQGIILSDQLILLNHEPRTTNHKHINLLTYQLANESTYQRSTSLK